MTNFVGFKTKEELTSHMESVLSSTGEYEGTNCIVKQQNIGGSGGKKIFFVKNKGRMFSHWCSTLEEAVERFLEYQKDREER